MNRKACLSCNKLGPCSMATIKMIDEEKGCDSWEEAPNYLIAARKEIIKIAGEYGKLVIIKSNNKVQKEE